MDHTATRLWAGFFRIQTLAEARDSSLLQNIQPPIQWILGAFPQRIKWPGHEVDHSISVDVKNELSCTSALPYAFMVWTGQP